MTAPFKNLKQDITELNAKLITYNDVGKNSGFHVVLPNGYTVSIQISSMAYCNNRKYYGYEGDWTDTAENAEIAYWYGNNPLIKFSDGDTVQGWVSYDDLIKFIFEVSKY